MKTVQKPSEKLYQKYEYLAKKYAYSLEGYDKISFTREDLIQEFSIKIFTTIKSYGRKWGQYRRGESSRPIALKYYIETALSNKRKDFMKYIERESGKCSIDDVSYDFGVAADTHIDPSHNEFVLHDIDLLEGLTGIERSVYSLFLRGHNKRFLSKVYSNKAGEGEDPKQAVEDLIERQKQYLIKKYGNELTQATQIYSSYKIED